MIVPLGDAQHLEVVSDASTVQVVSALPPSRQPPVGPKSLQTVPEVRRWPGPVVPLELLHLLGRAFTPVLAAGPFELSSLWAIYRYCWAFAPADPGRGLRLSDEAFALVDHHRALASEQIGIACALMVGLWVLAARHPGWDVDFVDADVALDPKSAFAGRLGLRQATGSRRMRPDYFLLATDPSTDVTTVYALESKGTHGVSHWRTQMQRGASQVLGVEVQGTPPPSFVVSTFLSDRGLKVRVLDPPGGDEWTGRAGTEPRSEPTMRRTTDPERGERFDVTDPDGFRGELLDLARASRLAFAGQFASAAEALPARVREVAEWRVPPADSPPQLLSDDFGDFQVQRLSLPVGSNVVDIITGIERAELRWQRVPRNVTGRRSESARRVATERDQSVAGTSLFRVAEDGGRLRSLRPDGTYLEVSAR